MGPMTDSAGAPPPRAVLTVTDAGISGLTPETGYGPKSIGAALPGFNIETIQTAGENDTQWTYAAFRDGMQMVQIFKGKGGKIGVVHGVGDAVAGPNGERLGHDLCTGTSAAQSLPGRQKSVARHGHMQGCQHREGFACLCHFGI